MKSNKRQHKSAGFTLIEVMMVIVLLGFMASVVQFTVAGNSPEDRLEKVSARFLSVFNVASDHALLNNAELGLVVAESSYQFLVFDGKEWVEVPDNPLLDAHILPEGILVSIELEDLPIEEPQLIDTLVEAMNDDDSLFEGTDIGRDEDEDFVDKDDEIPEGTDEDGSDGINPNEDSLSKEQKKALKKKKFPQVFILSGGDISPFQVEFSFDDYFVETDDLSYQVTGMYSTPLTTTGPLYGGAPKS